MYAGSMQQLVSDLKGTEYDERLWHTGCVGIRSSCGLGAGRRLRGGPTWHHDGHDSWVKRLVTGTGGHL